MLDINSVGHWIALEAVEFVTLMTASCSKMR